MMSREERIEILKTQKVMKKRLFDPNIIDKPGMVELVEYIKCNNNFFCSLCQFLQFIREKQETSTLQNFQRMVSVCQLLFKC